MPYRSNIKYINKVLYDSRTFDFEKDKLKRKPYTLAKTYIKNCDILVGQHKIVLMVKLSKTFPKVATETHTEAFNDGNKSIQRREC